MEHIHDAVKAVEKAEGSPIRKSTAPQLSSGAGALLHLQRVAGNQAVAKMLAASGGGDRGATPGVESSGPGFRDPITVQRNELDAAILKVKEGTKVDFLEFARKLVKKIEEQTTTASKEGGSAQEKVTAEQAKSATGGAAVPGIATTDDLAEREKQLKLRAENILAQQGLLSETQEKRLAKSKELDRLEAEIREAERPFVIQEQLKEKQRKLEEGQKEYEARVTKLQQGLTPKEIELRNKNEELKVLEQQKQDEEDRQAKARKRAMEARLLNPQKKSMAQLKGGVRFFL